MPARAVKWFTTIRQAQALVDGGQITFDLLSALSQANAKGSTVTRMIMDLVTRADTLSSTKATDFGVVWMHADAVAAGAFPDADDEGERVDWLVRGQMITEPPALGSEFGGAGRKSMDLRTQRICRADDDQLRLIFDDPGLGSGGVFVDLMVRTLVKLP